MNTREIRQLAIALRRDYLPHLHRENLPRDEQQRDTALLSRGLAAMAARILTGWGHRQSAASVIDGYSDKGIDAIAADKEMKCVFLIQSKWRTTGNKTLDEGEAHKFIEGMRLLLSGRFDCFNARLQELRTDIESVLRQPGARIILVAAITVNHKLPATVSAIFDQEIARSNQIKDFISLRHLRLDDFRQAVIKGLENRGPTVVADLVDYGFLKEPYKALHGRIWATELGNWYAEHGDLLFESNIRREIVDSHVNRCIVRTLIEEPDHFWYFNNGVTILCSDWPHAPAIGNGGKPEHFSFTDVSIVNGAQTVASIHHAMQMNLEAVKRAQVSVRFIALKECPDGFGSHVTYATNFQNSVDSRDFIALDPEQMRLRKEFKLDLGKEYTLRRGDSPPGASAGCSVIDAVIALACANSDVRFAVMTKNQIAELWKSTETSPYRDLFNPGTSAVEVWRRVRVMRKIDAAMQSSRAQEEGLAKEVALKCDRIVAHLVIRLMNNEGIDNPDIEWEVNLKTVEPLATKVLRGLTESVNAELGERGSVERMTKNVTKCRKLVEQVLDNFDADAELPDETNTKLAELRDGIRGPEFWLRRPGISARGYRFGQKKFLVLKDSIAASTGTPSLYPRYSRRRSQLIDELTLRPTTEGTQLVLAQDELFDSPSDAGAVIAGCIINGPKEWRTVEGIPLTQFEKEEEGASDTTGSA